MEQVKLIQEMLGYFLIPVNSAQKCFVTMHIARKMLNEGLITEEEYRQIDTIFSEKYQPTLGTLFADIDLL